MTFALQASPSEPSCSLTSETGAVLEADLHCHLMPDWDDGPRTLEDSLQMAARAAQYGVRRIVVTPHVGRAFGGAEPPSCDIPIATAALERKIHERDIALDLIPGAEITLSVPYLAARIKDEPWLTVGGQGHYILVESPWNTWPESADEILFELSLSGVTPIIAHPERLVDVQRDVEIMKRLVERGVLLQVTARSLTSRDAHIRDCCRRLLREGLVSFVASDAHKYSHSWPTEVAPALQEMIGQTAMCCLLVKNPLLVLAGAAVAPPKIELPARKRSWF